VNRYVLSRHALSRCEEMGLTHADIERVVLHPEVDYCATKNRGVRTSDNQRIAKRGDLSVVYDCRSHTVITVLLNRQEQWDRAKDKVR
jgi:hypothetical protein